MQGSWGRTHRQVVYHFCDVTEALLAAGCPPVPLFAAMGDGARMACPGLAGIPGDAYCLDLPRWARPHLR